MAITQNVNSLVTDMHQALVTYAPSSAPTFDPILSAMGSKVVADSIAMSQAGTGSNAATAALVKQYGADTAALGGEEQAILMSTSGIPKDTTSAVSKDLFSVMGGAGSQMAPTDPNAQAELWMGVGALDKFNPFGSSSLTPGNSTPGGSAVNPSGSTSAGIGTFQVAPDALGLGPYAPYAFPDAPPAPVGSAPVGSAPVGSAPVGSAPVGSSASSGPH